MSTTKAGKRPLRSLTAHEKLEAIRRVHDGESKASVARDIGVPESTLRGWCKNEEKISYISRQSSPDTDDSAHGYEFKEKKPKLDDAYNLSLKSNPRLSYSPTSDLKYPVDYTKTEEKPLNLNVKVDKTPMSERERNRAELARLSIELGLNRPEMYSQGAGTFDFSTNINLLTQWNQLLMQQQTQQQKPKKVSGDFATTPTTATAYKQSDKLEKNKLPKLDPPKSVDESVWYWLKTQQAMLGLTGQNLTGGASTAANFDKNSWFWNWCKQYSQAGLAQNYQQLLQQLSPSQAAQLQNPTAKPTTPQLSPQQQIETSTLNLSATGLLQTQQQIPQEIHVDTTETQRANCSPPSTSPRDDTIEVDDEPKPILYQQLTKDKDLENESRTSPIPSPAPPQSVDEKTAKPPQKTKPRSVLDTLILTNNNNNLKRDAEDVLSLGEALEHGEKFLGWLECCGDPCVTAMQIMQFRTMINNLRNGADRRNGCEAPKPKVRRK